MPRLRGYRRAEAARKREQRFRLIRSDPQLPPADTFASRSGTGTCPKMTRSASTPTGRHCELVAPPPASDKKFVLIVGASHLRPFANGFVHLPGERMSFEFLPVPAATMKELCTELQHATLHRVPDAICVMAPRIRWMPRTTSAVADAFSDLLRIVMERCPKVFVHDFVPLLTVNPEHQELIRQELCRVTGCMGIRYFTAAEHFPFDRLDLWCKSGEHLSATSGSRILGDLLSQSAHTFFESPVVVAANRSSPPAGTACSKVVGTSGCVEQLVTVPLACQASDSDGKSPETVRSSSCSVSSQQGQHKEEFAGFGLLERFTPLNPSNFSEQELEVMDTFCPSDLEDSHNEQGQSEDTQEAERKLLVEEMEKQNPSGAVIASKMDQTFPLRRREIVEAIHPVKTLKNRWPALFTEKQVFAEFSRVVPKNLKVDFFEALDRHTPHFIQIFKAKRGRVGKTMTELVQQIDAQKPDVTAMRTIVLRGLPVLLGDDPSDFYNTCHDCDTDKTWAQVSVGLLTVVCEDVQLSPNQLHLHPVSTAIIVEGAIVMDDLQNLPEALCLLFGLSYALHLDYPEAMRNTFDFIQTVMLGLGENKLPSLLSS